MAPEASSIRPPAPSSLPPRARQTELAPVGEDAKRVVAGLPSQLKESVVAEVPVTLRHLPPADLEKSIPNPGLPRNQVITKENPEPSPNVPSNYTPLQQHVLFWDRDHDGVIWPHDTYIGFRRLGFSYLLSFAAPFVIHGTFSYPSGDSWIPHPGFPIKIKNMHRTKHGSDSEVYDTEGRFVPQKFEEIFSKYDRENKGALSWDNIQEMVYSNSNVNDFVGWIAGRLEWWTFWLLAKDEHSLVSKDKFRGMYDGTLWEVIAADVERRRKSGRQARHALIKSD